VGLSDFSEVETALLEIAERTEVVDEDFAVDFRRVKFGAAFPEERRFRAASNSPGRRCCSRRSAMIRRISLPTPWTVGDAFEDKTSILCIPAESPATRHRPPGTL